MKGLKRTTAWALAALMCASSLLQPVTVTAATDNSVVAEETDQSSVSPESDGKKTEVLEFAETETEHTLNVTILNGNGKLIFHDEETGYEKEIFKNSEGSGLFPIPLIISVDELQLEVVPETGYEVALYKTKIDGGAVQEEITDTALLNQEGNYKTKVNTGEITEIEVAFQEKPMEEAEAPQPENQPEEKVTEKPAENSLEDEPFYNQEVKEILGGMEADLSIVPPTEEENTACNEAFSSDLQEGVGFFSAQEYDDVGAIGSTQYCGSLTTDNDWEHAEIKVYDYWDGYESGWAEVDSWQRGVIGTHGIPAYCTEPGVHYENEDRLVHNARDYYSQNIITLLGLVCKYIEDIPDDEFMIGAQEGGKDISQVYAGKYYVKQVLIWNIMERYYPHYGQYHNIQFEISNAYISASYIGSLISLALQFADLNKDKYTGYGKILFNEGSSYQKVGVFTAVPTEGGIEVRKSSAKPEITDGNDCYSLEGAEYGIYQRGTSNQVAKITTDNNGYGKVDSIPVGTYDIREIKAPKGYALDQTTGSVTVTANQTVTYSCHDYPQSDPVTILLGKVDKETNANKPQGSASLENALFTVKFYKGLYDTDPAEQGKQAERTWVVKTDERGFTRLADKYKVSGDDFYKLNGVVTLPLGTVTIQEKEPPKGYIRNPEIFVRKITPEGHAEQVQTYNAPTVPEEAQKGIIRLKKVDAETDGKPSSIGSLEGAKYEVYDSAGTKVDTLVTDKNGEAQSKKLPMGTYTVKETAASSGYVLDKNTYTVEFDGDTSNTPLFYKDITSREQPQKGVIRLQKTDKETGGKPVGDGTLKGAKYEVYNSDGEKADTLVTDEEGKAKSKELALGTYTVKEVLSSAGYVKDPKTYTVTLKPDTSNAAIIYGDVGSPEQPQKGVIRLQKRDAETDKTEPQGAASLKGAQYEIKNSKGKIVDTLTTDKEGKAQSKKLILGTYTVKESKAPEGYNPDQTTYTVKLTSENREDTVFYKNVKSPEEVIRGDVQIVKFGANADGEDTDIKKPLKGIKFIFTSKTTGKKYTIVTDENGYANTQQLGNPRGGLIYDTYIVTEDSPYPDYAEIAPFEVTIRDENKTLYYVIENDVIEAPVSVVKKDATTGKIIPVAGTKFQILDSNKKIIEMTVSHYPHLIKQDTWETDVTGSFMLPEKLRVGTYYLKEVEAPEGYLKGQLLEFKVDGSYEWDKPLVVEYEDTPVMGKIEIQKSDVTTGEKLAGAVFEITAAEDITTPDGTVRAAKGEVVDTITTDEKGVAVSKALYLGKYKVKEIKPAPGFELSDKSYKAELKYKDQTTALVKDTLEITNKPTQVIIDKKVTGTEQRLSGVKFAVWNKAMTDDIDAGIAKKDIIVTDKNGQAKIEYLLPGTYCIQEVEGIAGYAMDDKIYEFTIDENGKVKGEGEFTIENAKTEITKTNAVSVDTGGQEGITKAEVQIKDTVSFKNLQVGAEVVVKGILMDKETQNPLLVDGKEVTAEMKFIAEKSEQSIENLFKFNASQLAGKEIVVFEKAYIGEIEIAAHEDLEDKDQTVTFPKHEIQTTARDKDTGNQQAVSKEKTTIVDKVKYSGLIVGQEYTVKGVLMDKSTGKELLVNGKPVTAEKTFKAEKPEGYVELEFTFD
ncbi:SpaA isopeptide-forming pilin-related protein, partial [Blautia sp.]|uniref:SpaA isopeptide-forming pilin-related protein n=1 Tax=Blautia sp. TaxID=1955243 RepID=UPI00258A2B8E